MKKLLSIICVLSLSACGMFGGDDEGPGTKPPVQRYEWVKGPIVHPVTGKNCSKGYCKDRPLKDDADSGCNSAPEKCPKIK